MKTVASFAAIATLMSAPALAQSQLTEVYGIHLYFNEKEYVDVMTLKRLPDGRIQGMMQVPNDFSGKLENLVLTGRSISFDLLVPKNSARPKDLIFHYEGHFYDKTRRQLAGFVTLRDQTQFIASFVGFRRVNRAELLQ